MCWKEALLWTTILLIVLMAPIRMKALVCNRALARLGVLSYSIYIVHLPIIHFSFLWLRHQWPGSFVGWSGETVAAVSAIAMICVALSEVTYRVIEQPFLRRKALIGSSVRRIDRARRARRVDARVEYAPMPSGMQRLAAPSRAEYRGRGQRPEYDRDDQVGIGE